MELKLTRSAFARTLLGEVIGQTLQVVEESGSEIAQIKLSESGLSD
jgi:hypothetical protein